MLLAKSVESQSSDNRGTPLIVVQGVTKSFYATRALTDVSMTVDVGQSHALLGRNGAGKSTLVSLMTGLMLPDLGSISINGEPAPPVSDRMAWMGRVACVYQKSRLVPQLSVAENLFLNTARRNAVGAVSWRWIQDHATKLLGEWEIDLDPQAEADTLTIAQKRLVELARALSFGCRFIILDEPTAGLDGREVLALLTKIKSLQTLGVTFLYISHHLEETFELCHTATVLRDGRTVLTSPVKSLSHGDLVSAMVGTRSDVKSLDRRKPTIRQDRGSALKVSHLSFRDLVSDASFEVRRGEILGLAGLAGSGKGEIAKCIGGLLKPGAGTIAVAEKGLQPGNPSDAIKKGVGFVGHDRHHDGFVVGDTIADNASMSTLSRTAKWGIINGKAVRSYAEKAVSELSIKTQSINEPVFNLSGGNQQKVVLARALASDPELLVLVNPLAGVDIASIQVLYSAVSDIASAGTGVLVVSDDLDELAICDSVQIIFKGRLTRRFESGWDPHAVIAAIEGIEG